MPILGYDVDGFTEVSITCHTFWNSVEEIFVTFLFYDNYFFMTIWKSEIFQIFQKFIFFALQIFTSTKCKIYIKRS